MTTDWTKTAKLLKAVVIGLGVLIVLGIGLIVYKLISRADVVVVDSVVSAALPVAPGASAEAIVKLPSGSRVVGMIATGDHLSLLVEDAQGRQQIMTVDRLSGVVLGILTVETE